MELHCTPGDRPARGRPGGFPGRSPGKSRRASPRDRPKGLPQGSAPRVCNVTIRPMTQPAKPSHFIRDAVLEDLQTGRFSRPVVTRFPPEPNGYLHIGHAKAICLDFGLAQELGGRCHLRFDDTNPTKESQEYVDAITRDVHWLGYDWGQHLYFASDYFGRLYEWAVQLIRAGKAYVDDLSADEIREHRGTLTEPGRESRVAQPVGGGEPGSLRAHARGRVRGREQGPAREDRHGPSEPQPARPGDVPHPQDRTSPHRRRLVRVPHVRLGARPVRLDRGRHPLAVHARVRGPSPALRLVPRRAAASITRGRSSSRA